MQDAYNKLLEKHQKKAMLKPIRGLSPKDRMDVLIEIISDMDSILENSETALQEFKSKKMAIQEAIQELQNLIPPESVEESVSSRTKLIDEGSSEFKRHKEEKGKVTIEEIEMEERGEKNHETKEHKEDDEEEGDKDQ
jgi:hypothetical protein